MKDNLQKESSDDLKTNKSPGKRRKFIRPFLFALAVLVLFTGTGIVLLHSWIKPAEIPAYAGELNATEEALPSQPAAPTAGEGVTLSPRPNDAGPAPTSVPTLAPPAPDGFSSADRKPEFYTFTITGLDSTNNTDTLMVASYDGVNKKANIIGIPRDCLVDVPRELKKINAAYPLAALNGGGKKAGMAELQKEIKTIIGFVPDFYVLVNFKAVTDTVDIIGGIEVDVPFHMLYDDPEQGLHIDIPKGLQQHLNGEDALHFARYRKGNNGMHVISDYDRINNQQTVIKAVMNKMLRPRNILRIPQFIQIFNDNVYSNITTGNMIWFANEVKKISGTDALAVYTMPTDGTSGEPMFYEYLDRKRVIDLVNETINPYTKDITADDVDIIRHS